MGKTREEHILFCKEQAKKQYEFDMSGKQYSDPERAIINAIASMLSDLSKHPETEGLAQATFLLSLTVQDERALMRFIDGFN